MSLSKKEGGTNAVSKERGKASCQKWRMGKGNILFSESKDSVSTENNGGYKKIVVSPNKPRQFGFLC